MHLCLFHSPANDTHKEENMTQGEMIDILRKYYGQIKTSFEFRLVGEIKEKALKNALKIYAPGVDKNTIVGLYDTTVFGSGKLGYLFTTDKIYYKEDSKKPKKLWYEEIEFLELSEPKLIDDASRELTFHLIDGTTLTWSTCCLNKTPLYAFFQEVLDFSSNANSPDGLAYNCDDYDSSYDDYDIYEDEPSNPAAFSGGYGIGNYGNVNKSFHEEKFHARQGHGFAAERANHLYDKFSGKDAHILGDNNQKNGADRIVDGVELQSKYCKTGSRCINECFSEKGKGEFRYYKNGKPMQIEVPSDNYDAAVEAMAEKIRRGQVVGVSDPKEAKNLVRKGHFTYEQARNIAKAGTVESLTYDSINGTIIATSAFGVSAVISFATSIWNGEDFEIALQNAAFSGVKIGGTAFITSILTSQLSKAGLNSALVNSSETAVKMMGKMMGNKSYTILANAFRNGSNISGAAAMRSAAKVLRGNVITAGVTVAVLSTVDIANIFQGRISGKQLFKNLTNTTSTVAGGAAGWLGGAALGSAIPIVGTIVGGLIGSVAVGTAAGKATDTVLDAHIKDDAEEMISIIQKQFEILAVNYLLSSMEAEKSADTLQEKLNGKILKDMYASDNREEFAQNLLLPIVENQTNRRKKIFTPNEQDMTRAITTILEELDGAIA